MILKKQTIKNKNSKTQRFIKCLRIHGLIKGLAITFFKKLNQLK